MEGFLMNEEGVGVGSLNPVLSPQGWAKTGTYKLAPRQSFKN
jgi:hypothetical protein